MLMENIQNTIDRKEFFVFISQRLIKQIYLHSQRRLFADISIHSIPQCMPDSSAPPMSDIYSCDIARSGLNHFRKVDAHYWSTITSQFPIPKNAQTKITIQLISGNSFLLGCGLNFVQKLCRQFVGQIPNTVSYFTETGQKYRNVDAIDYSSPAQQGDNITMSIDLRPYKYYVQFQKNGLPLGIAYSGLSKWDQIYIMISIHYAGHSFKITDYSVTYDNSSNNLVNSP